jgi:hypothetical protein
MLDPSRGDMTMKMALRMAVVALLTLACAGGAVAQSLKVREQMTAQEKAPLKDVAISNKICESHFTVRFNWTAVPQADLNNYSPEGYCDNGLLLGLRQVCGYAAGKAAVKEKIKHMTCGFGAERAISLKNGVLIYKINFNSSNDFDFVYDYLQHDL